MLGVITCLLASIAWGSPFDQTPAQKLASPQPANGGGTKQRIITNQLRKDDPDLDKLINLDERRASIGSVADAIGRQSGIRVVVDQHLGAADEPVCVYCRDVSAYKVLNGLWSAMSCRGAEWEWRRSGNPGDYRYEFIKPASADRLASAIRVWEHGLLGQELKELLDAANGSDDQRRQAIRNVFHMEPERLEYELTFSPEKLWADIRTFQATLTAEQQSGLIQEGGRIDVPMSAAPEASRAFYHQASLSLSAQMGASRPEADFVQIESTKYYGTPALSVGVANATSGYPIVGGEPLTLEFWGRMHELWQLDGDTADAPNPVRPMSPDASLHISAAAGGRVDLIDQLAWRLAQVGSGSANCVVARLPTEEAMWTPTLSDPAGQTVPSYWKQLWNKDLMVKWRDGVQIASVMSWPNSPPPIPTALLRKLHKAAAPGRYLPLEMYMEAASILSPGQLDALEFHFPGMHEASQLRPLLMVLHDRPGLLEAAESPGGAPISAELADALRATFPMAALERVARGGGAASFSVSFSEYSGAIGPASRTVEFAVNSSARRHLAIASMHLMPMPAESKQAGGEP